ncbi:MAG: 30S ribosome-binding factor RbfA [Tepidisphaeraceae bacterium]
MSRRTERLASVIRQEVAMMILRDLSDPRIKLAPSVTRVEVTEDLSVADVFVTIMGTPGQQTMALNALKHAAGMMRQKLSKAIDIRTVPFLRFQMDEGQKKEIEMLELLHKIEQERLAAEGQRSEATETPTQPEEKPAEG